MAHVRAAELVGKFVSGEEAREQAELERKTRAVTFREVAHAYLDWLERVRDGAPSTLRQHRSDLSEPGVKYKRGDGHTAGHIMKALGDRPAARITTKEINDLLEAVAETGVKARTVNRVRAVVSAVFSYGMRDGKFELPKNPVARSDLRNVPPPAPLTFYEPSDIEAVAQALESGAHREYREREPWEEAADRRDADAVRVAGYTGLRLGELRALRWKDIDWRASAITVSRGISAGVQRGTKSRRIRRFGMPDQAAAALRRLAEREHYISADDLVFCNELGRPVDDSSLRKRYKQAQAAAGVDKLRWHDLRHTFGSLLVAGGVDLVSVKEAMGHSQIQTTMIYTHARSATQMAGVFTKALGGDSVKQGGRPSID
jgi:integrase